MTHHPMDLPGKYCVRCRKAKWWIEEFPDYPCIHWADVPYTSATIELAMKAMGY